MTSEMRQTERTDLKVSLLSLSRQRPTNPTKNKINKEKKECNEGKGVEINEECSLRRQNKHNKKNERDNFSFLLVRFWDGLWKRSKSRQYDLWWRTTSLEGHLKDFLKAWCVKYYEYYAGRLILIEMLPLMLSFRIQFSYWTIIQIYII